MPTDKNGGPNHLREWREFKGLSQEALAEKVGTTSSVISYLEQGERGLSAKWLRKLSKALGTTPGLLLDHDPTHLDAEIVDFWTRANEHQRRQMIAMTKVISGSGTNG